MGKEPPFRLGFKEWSEQQTQFLNSKNNQILLRAPRRAGKSTSIAQRLIKDCLTPINIMGKPFYPPCLYIAPTAQQAKDILWDEIERLLKASRIRYETNMTEKKFIFPRPSSEGNPDPFIKMEGAGLSESVNRARGKKFKTVAIDEAAFLPYLRELVGIWSPTLGDYDGTMIISCTPGKTPSGFFYECDEGKGREHWEQFYLNPHDNPLFKSKKGGYQAIIDNRLETLYGGNDQIPEFRREWLGEWVHDTSNLLIKFDPDRDITVEPHKIDHTKWDYILGLDLGFLDSTAVTVLAVHKYKPMAEFVDCFEESAMRIGAIVDLVDQFASKYSTETVIVDSGGFGKHTFEELAAREHLKAIPAHKRDKVLHIELLNNDLASGRLKVNKSCGKLIESWEKVLKDVNTGKEDEKSDYGNKYVLDLVDSALYAHFFAHPQIYDKIEIEETYEQRLRRKAHSKKEESGHGLDEFFNF